MECDRNVVRRWWRQFQHTGNVTRKSGSGRPRKGSERDDNRLIASLKQNRFAPVGRLMKLTHFVHQPPYSIRTAYRRCLQNGYRSFMMSPDFALIFMMEGFV